METQMKEVTLRQAIEIAIAAEQFNQQMFLGLAAKFRQRADLVAFWNLYAADEVRHAQWIQGLEAGLDEAALSRTVDPQTIRSLQAVSNLSVEKALQQVNDLEDAYQLVSEVENGETNAIFRFLFENFERDAQMRDFLRAQLDKHISRLTNELPRYYRSVLTRRGIKAVD